MPSWTSASRIITVLSLVALCTLSFSLVFGTDTLAQDTLAHPKINNLHHRRALHPARASIPPSAADPIPSQSNPPPSQSAPPPANTPASSPPPVPSPPPSSQSPPAPQSFSSSPSPSPATSTSPGTTSAPPTPTSTSSSSPSPSPSPSSNTQVSSSPRVTSSSVGAVSNNANNPTTTFVNTPNTPTSGLAGSLPTTTGSTLTIDATATGAAVSSGFFKNKAAVGATFSILGIVGGLAVIMTVLTILKRHRRAREAIEDEEFFEKYPSGDGDFGDVPHTPPGFGTGSLSASVTEVSMSAAPPDAYPDRAIHYGQSNPSTVLNPAEYGIAYPPDAAASGNGYDDVGPSHSASHPFADPANASFMAAAPPVTFPRPIPGRALEMVTTDSYYGPNTAGVGAGVGYAE